MLLQELFRLDERTQTLKEVLEPFKNDPTIFVTYSSLQKVGINPESEFNTPVGIYTYPLKEMYDAVITRSVPFASERPLVHVLRAQGHVIDLSEYSEADLERDQKKLFELYGNRSPMAPSTRLWALQNLVRAMPADEAETAMAKMEEDPARRWQILCQQAKSKARVQRPGGAFWNLTRLLALNLSPNRETRLNAGAALWNVVLRALGYDGLTDRYGFGIIHENEPSQAVFLHVRAVRHLLTARNFVREPGMSTLPSNPFDATNVIRGWNSFLYLMGGITEPWDDDGYTKHQTKVKQALVRHMLAEWKDFRTNGETAHFKFGDGYDASQFAEDIRENFDTYIAELQNVSPKLLPIITWESVKAGENASEEHFDDLITRADGRDPKTLRPLFANAFLDAAARAKSTNREWMWAYVSENAVRVVLTQSKGQINADLFSFGKTEQERMAAARQCLKPIWGLLHPAQKSDEALFEQIERHVEDSIPF